jgi:hypothetical protein
MRFTFLQPILSSTGSAPVLRKGRLEAVPAPVLAVEVTHGETPAQPVARPASGGLCAAGESFCRVQCGVFG